MKRQRILDAYFEGVISRSERDSRIAKVDLDRTALEAILARDRPRPELTLDTLVSAFAPFTEFDLLSRDDKRRLLNMLMPQITVLKYEVRGMSLCLNTIHTDTEIAQRRYSLTLFGQSRISRKILSILIILSISGRPSAALDCVTNCALLPHLLPFRCSAPRQQPATPPIACSICFPHPAAGSVSCPGLSAAGSVCLDSCLASQDLRSLSGPGSSVSVKFETSLAC